MSVVNPMTWSLPFEDSVPRPSQELPQQAMGPWTRWAVSAIGWSTIIAPSKAQDSPPRERQTFALSSVEQPLRVSFSIVVTIHEPQIAQANTLHSRSALIGAGHESLQLPAMVSGQPHPSGCVILQQR